MQYYATESNICQFYIIEPISLHFNGFLMIDLSLLTRGMCQNCFYDFSPGYAHTMTEIDKERSWPNMTCVTTATEMNPEIRSINMA
jgi:hypothetical protein